MIKINRGVKQGDPLSPILFNMVMNELLESLSERRGIPLGETNIPALAYADDMVVLAENARKCRSLLKTVTEFLGERKLQLNISKCSFLTLGVVPSKKKVYLNGTPIHYIEGKPIKPLTIDGDFKYLGSYFSSREITKCNIHNLNEQLGRIMRAPLKPYQKIIIIKEHLVLRYVHAMQSPAMNLGILKQCDLKLKRAVKKVLHLPTHIFDEGLFTPVKMRGIGLFHFEKKIPKITKGRDREADGEVVSNRRCNQRC